MRELKFKAVRLENNKYIVAEPFSLYEYVNGSESEDIKNGQVIFPEGTLFLQFTGLKDKNGKEIYEGDILDFFNDRIDKPKHFVGDVFWVNEWSQFGIHTGEKNEAFIDFERATWLNLKIIGNIYLNPELLGVKE